MSTRELKIELKLLAKKITETKKQLKECQRENNGSDGGYYHDIEKLKYEFRHKHIAYCQLRGRKYEEIERHCSDDNQPNLNLIKEIMDEHQTKDVENVRLSA